MAARKNITNLREELLKSSLPMQYLRQPIEFTFLKQNLSLSQINFIIEIIDLLQDKIKLAIEKGKDEYDKFPSLFSREEMYSDGIIPMTINMSSLNVSPAHYKDLEKSVNELQGMKIVFNGTDENGNPIVKHRVLFPNIDIPHSSAKAWDKYDEHGFKIDGKRRTGEIRIGMLWETANALFTFNQYTPYLKTVTQSCSSQYTVKLYMCLSNYKNDVSHGCKWNVSYNELRRIMGVTEFLTLYSGKYYNSRQEVVTFAEDEIEERIQEGVWVRTALKGYGNFKQKVLSRVKSDFEELVKNEGTDIDFDYTEVMPDGKKRGEPERIIFTVHRTKVGELVTQHNAEVSFRNKWKRRFVSELDLSNSQAETLASMVTPENDFIVEKTIISARAELQKSSKIKNPKLYYYKAIKNELENHDVPLAEEVTEDTTPSVPEVSRKDAELFAKLLGEVDATWREALSLYEVTSDKVYVRMPAPATYETFIETGGGKSFFDNVKKTYGKEVKVKY